MGDKAAELADIRNTHGLWLAVKVVFGSLRGTSFVGALIGQATMADAEFGELCRTFSPPGHVPPPGPGG
ncbi:MAG: hypothetical protein LBC97_04235 [Bifidobacteriaceae bacterium]|jgi:hypothetical protein|nr:hypothetical protein [Bifidobacteriaceae bacterium]